MPGPALGPGFRIGGGPVPDSWSSLKSPVTERWVKTVLTQRTDTQHAWKSRRASQKGILKGELGLPGGRRDQRWDIAYLIQKSASGLVLAQVKRGFM